MDKVSQAGQQVTDNAQSAGQQAQQSVAGGGEQWNAMSEEQKKKTFDSLPEDKKQGKTYMQWISEGYYNQKENWMPWIEDVYLKWFTNDNKASYATKGTLDKSKVTGVEQVDTLQDGVNNLASQQVGKGGLLQPVGDAFSKEGINRAERGGKDADGTYGVPANQSQGYGSSVLSGAKSAGSYVGGMFGGGSKEAEQAGQK